MLRQSRRSMISGASFRAAHPLGNAARLRKLEGALVDFARPERVQLLDGHPSRVVVLFPDDDGEQLFDGMHGPMLLQTCAKSSPSDSVAMAARLQ